MQDGRRNWCEQLCMNLDRRNEAPFSLLLDAAGGQSVGCWEAGAKALDEGDAFSESEHTAGLALRH